MFLLIGGICVILFILYIAYVWYSARKNKKFYILCALGLAYGLPYGFRSHFYKWGWRKTSDNRVWAERIVRQAFEKANIGLSLEDMEFFKGACDRYANGKKVDNAFIARRVERIVSTSVSVHRLALDIIQPILDDALNTSPNRAQEILHSLGIQPTSGNEVVSLAGHRFSDLLKHAGAAIFHPNGIGYKIKNKEGEVLIALKGLEGWEHWLNSLREGVEQYVAEHTLSRKRQQFRLLENQLVNVVLKNHLEYLQESKKFISLIQGQISQGEMQISQADIKRVEDLLFYWEFAESHRFSTRIHKNLRRLLCRKELASKFREIFIQKIESDIGSVLTLPQYFPRHVIFYGSDYAVVSYAAQEYMDHLQQLIHVLAQMLGRAPRSPLYLQILESDIAKARKGDFVEIGGRILDPKRIALEKTYKNEGHMLRLLNILRGMAMFEQNMDATSVNTIGLIVELQTDTLTPQEQAQLDRDEYRSYKRLDCNRLMKIDLESESAVAQVQRQKFMNEIFTQFTRASSL